MRVLLREDYIDIGWLNGAGALDAHIVDALWNLVLMVTGGNVLGAGILVASLVAPITHCQAARTIP